MCFRKKRPQSAARLSLCVLAASTFYAVFTVHALASAERSCPATTDEILLAQDLAIAAGDLRTSRFLSNCRPQSAHEAWVLVEGEGLELPEQAAETHTIPSEPSRGLLNFLRDKWQAAISGWHQGMPKWWDARLSWTFVILLFILPLIIQPFWLRSHIKRDKAQRIRIQAQQMGLRFQPQGTAPAFCDNKRFVLFSNPTRLFEAKHSCNDFFLSGQFPTIFNYDFYRYSFLSDFSSRFGQTVYCFKNRRTRFNYKIMRTFTARDLAKARGEWTSFKFRLGFEAGREDVSVGDAAFDNLFHIEGDSEAELRDLLDGHVRRRLTNEIGPLLIIEATPEVTIFYRFSKVDRGDELLSNYRNYRDLHAVIDS